MPATRIVARAVVTNNSRPRISEPPRAADRFGRDPGNLAPGDAAERQRDVRMHDVRKPPVERGRVLATQVVGRRGAHRR
jgi:hypothetical protein